MDSAISTANKRYDNNFGIIRIIAALMVMANHMSIISGGSPTIIQGVGVRIFFLLGGYMTTKSLIRDPNTLRFFVKKVFRIVPALTVYVLFTALIIGPIFSSLSLKEYYTSTVTWKYLRNIIFHVEYFLPGVFENLPYPNAVNGSLWSLPVEMLMCILMPIILCITGLGKNTRSSKIFISFFFVGVCIFPVVLNIFYPNAQIVIYSTDWIQGLQLMPYYMIGSLFTLSKVQKYLNLQVSTILILICICVSPHYPLSELCKMAVLSYFIFSLGFSKPAFFSDKLIGREISYGLYLYGFPIQQIIVSVFQSLGITLGYSGYFLLSIFLTSIPAYISYKFIEKPCSNLSRKILSGIKDNKVQLFKSGETL